MGYSIGPVVVEVMTAFQYSARRQNTTTSIPFGRTVGFPSGIDLVSYSISGLFQGTTVAAVKTKRRQLFELFNNKGNSAEYIKFDTDGDELSGWYLLNDISVDVPPNSPGVYPFQANVTRLSLKASSFISVYYKSYPYPVSGLSTGVNPWFSLPAAGGAQFSHDGFTVRTPEGSSGSSTNIVIDTSSTLNPFVIPDWDFSIDMHSNRCKVLDTMTTGDLAEANWEEVFSPEHQFGGDIVIENGFVRLKWSNDATAVNRQLSIYTYANGSYDLVASRVSVVIPDGSSNVSLAPIRTPVFSEISYDNVSWTMQYSALALNIASELSNLPIFRGSLKRGTWFVDFSLDKKSSIITYVELVANLSSVSNSANIGSGNYALTTGTTSNSNVIEYGFLVTKSNSVSYNANGSMTLSPVFGSGESRYYFGVFAMPDGHTSPNAAIDLGRQYLSNISQQLVIATAELL